MVANTLTTLSTDGAPGPRINAEVSSSSALARMLRSGSYLGCFAEPFAAMPDLGTRSPGIGNASCAARRGWCATSRSSGTGRRSGMIELVQLATPLSG